MFTGIIECTGMITYIRHQGSSTILLIEPEINNFNVNIGDSVAIDGTCLTLEQWEGTAMRFCAVAETLKKTTLSHGYRAQVVNIELAVLLGERLDGHFVYGHVDGIGTILRDRELNGSTLRTISVPSNLLAFMAEKGSVAIDGISLTIAQVKCSEITISLIPHSLAKTTLARKHPGDKADAYLIGGTG